MCACMTVLSTKFREGEGVESWVRVSCVFFEDRRGGVMAVVDVSPIFLLGFQFSRQAATNAKMAVLVLGVILFLFFCLSSKRRSYQRPRREDRA